MAPFETLTKKEKIASVFSEEIRYSQFTVHKEGCVKLITSFLEKTKDDVMRVRLIAKKYVSSYQLYTRRHCIRLRTDEYSRSCTEKIRFQGKFDLWPETTR
jgi:hypothetical protein